MFIVRPGKTASLPYSLTLYASGSLFNLQVRMRSDGKFALGSKKVNWSAQPRNYCSLFEYLVEVNFIEGAALNKTLLQENEAAFLSLTELLSCWLPAKSPCFWSVHHNSKCNISPHCNCLYFSINRLVFNKR